MAQHIVLALDQGTTSTRCIVFDEGGIPLLGVFNMSATVPCENLGFLGHGDCSHTCMPGPRDAWTEMLYNFVMHSPLIDQVLGTKH